MGDRYILTLKCPQCGSINDEVYYAPTCGFLAHTCSCGYVTDLEEYTGIAYDDASNKDALNDIVIRGIIAAFGAISNDTIQQILEAWKND